VAWGAAEHPDHGEAEVIGAEEERGGGARGLRGDAGLGLGFWGSGASSCRAAALPWRAGPGERRSPGISGAVARRGGRRRGRRKTLTRGAAKS
jgi:hypothetical protein